MNPRNGTACMLLVASFAWPAGAALACSCAPPGSPESELQQSAAVFRGRVLQSTLPHGDSGDRRHVFAVSEVWKGNTDPLQAISTPNSSARCGRAFSVGEEYLVYASHPGHVILCSRTAAIGAAASDLAVLGTGSPPQVATLADSLRHAFAAGSWYNPDRAGEGFLVDLLEDGRGLVYWFAYRPDASAQTWLYGIGEFDGDTLHVTDVYQTTGSGFGGGFDPQTVEQQRWGELRLTLHPDGTGDVQWSSVLTGYGSGSFAIERLARPPRVQLDDVP